MEATVAEGMAREARGSAVAVGLVAVVMVVMRAAVRAAARVAARAAARVAALVGRAS